MEASEDAEPEEIDREIEEQENQCPNAGLHRQKCFETMFSISIPAVLHWVR